MNAKSRRIAGPLVRSGEAASDLYSVSIDASAAGWGYSGLRVVDLGAGDSLRFATGDCETIVLPLRGSCEASSGPAVFSLAGRAGVFSAVSDFAYFPCGTEVEIRTATGGRFALPSARAERRLAPRYVPASQVAVELRGSGPASRQVNNFCTPETFEADRLIAVEVLTPGGNWSSYPPHKHDVDSDGESKLEEIYYFEVANDGPAYQRVYTSGPGREIDVLAQVSTGDVVLIPHGYHGPSMATPGYDLYYLNVMAGPGERAWRINDDPDHAWIRTTWPDQPIDARLPLTSAAGA